MRSQADRIRELHGQGHSYDEIIHLVGCSRKYVHAVASRARAPNEETRRRRTKTSIEPGSLRYQAGIAGWRAYSVALRQGASKLEAYDAYREVMRKLKERT